MLINFVRYVFVSIWAKAKYSNTPHFADFNDKLEVILVQSAVSVCRQVDNNSVKFLAVLPKKRGKNKKEKKKKVHCELNYTLFEQCQYC